jgi:hypothetical protein
MGEAGDGGVGRIRRTRLYQRGAVGCVGERRDGEGGVPKRRPQRIEGWVVECVGGTWGWCWNPAPVTLPPSGAIGATDIQGRG